MVKGLLTILSVMTIVFTILLIKDIIKHKSEFNSDKIIPISLTGLVMSFFDVFGIGCFTTSTAAFKLGNLVKDDLIPGTLNVGYTIAVVLEAFLFISTIEMDKLTLILMIVAASLGSLVGAGIISKLPERKIKLGIGLALIIVAFVMLAGKLNLMPVGGNESGLRGIKLFIALLGNFIFGGLMTIGVGLYAPCMALIYGLGMNAKLAFPIMMGSCAFLMPTAGLKFLKEGKYDRKASVLITIFSIIGTLAAYFIVKSMNVERIIWIVIAVLIFTGIRTLRELKPKINTNENNELTKNNL